MKRITGIMFPIASGLAFAAYVLAVVSGSETGTFIASPLCTLLCACALACAYYRTRDFRIHWLLGSLACLFWSAADLVWMAEAWLWGADPNQSPLVTWLYMLPSSFFTASAVLMLGVRRKIWDKIQLFLDILAVACMALAVAWILFFNEQFTALLQMSPEDLFPFAGAFSSLITIGCIGAWFLTLERWHLAPAMKIFVAGLLLYAITDLVYSYEYIMGIYRANEFLDIVYLLAMLLAGSGGYLQVRQQSGILTGGSRNRKPSGQRFKSAVLLAAPLFVCLVKGFEWREIAFLVGIFIVHQIISGYVNSAHINDKLRLHEKQMGQLLEEQIALRTQELVAINKELENVSNHDTVTSFYNRRYFLMALDRLLKEVKINETVVIFFIDLDRFKSINDTCGHDIGDHVLMEIARRIKAWNQYDAILARMGGDEFVCALRGHYCQEDVAGLAGELIRKCHEPISVPPYQFQITISVGATFYPDDAQDRGTLLKNADIAMYHAKAQGCNQLAFYNQLIHERVARKSELEHLLSQSDYDREFELYYQPIYDAANGTLTGAEALLHWNSPVLGSVPPAEFIPIAEEIGCIIPLGEWVLQQAAIQIRDWNRRYGRKLRISINISPQQLEPVRFAENLAQLVQRTGIDPEWLDLEIVERVAMNGAEPVAAVLHALSGIGVAVSIDNFGTGYSSLSYLQRFSIDRLKIARPLVENIAVNPGEYQIIKAIVLMAKALGIKTTAEGVETTEQLQILAELQCDEVQGFLTGQPMTAQMLEASCLKIHGRSAGCMI
ncbi:MAG TPA: GGDEF-domain containing protein [Clostridiales bacterium]|nr:GGDEF-domain containing protein [Clostridiales bacterium]